MSRATKSFFLGAAVGLAGVSAYLAPAIALRAPDVGAIYHRLQWHFVWPAGHRPGRTFGVTGDPRGVHRGQRLGGPLPYRRA
jgi:hypothetical protein